MCNNKGRCACFALCIVAAILTLLALVPAGVNATPPHPRLFDPGTGLPITPGRTPPDFPDWFGKGLRPLQAISGEGRAVALLIDFPDRQANTAARPDSFYRELFFSRGVHPIGSLRDFYLEQSYGAFDLTGDAYGWVRTSDEYYTTYDDGNYGFAGGARGMVVSAVLLADPIVDYGLFDSDGPDGIPNSGDDDGYVDACLIFHSGLGGHDTYNPSDVWPHAWSIEPPIETNDPRTGGGFILVEEYCMQPEVNLNAAGDDTLDSCLGVVAHEYGHLLGLPDLYDGSHQTWGIGYWGLMGYGSFGALRTGPYHLSAWSKVALGWVTPIVVTENMLDTTIPPVETEPVIYKVWRNGIPGEEYFLIENRQNLGFDTYLPGHGLLIWHIDEAMFPFSSSTQTVAATAEGWFRVALEQADGRNDLATYFERPEQGYYPELGDGADPFPGDSLNTSFDGYSNPSSHDNSGLPTDVSIVDIALEGNDIRLSIVIDSATVAVHLSDFRANIRDSGVELTWDVFADEAIVGFKLYRRNAMSDREISIPGYGLIPPERRWYVDVEVQAGETYHYVLSAVSSDGSELRSCPVKVSMSTVAFVLHQNYPNPFNPTTTISFSLPERAWINLSIFNVEGKLVRTLIDGTLSGGFKEVEWDGRDWRGNPVGSGVYLYRLKAGKHVIVQKMILLK
jgi:M6 family metalloprotease-like protein